MDKCFFFRTLVDDESSTYSNINNGNFHCWCELDGTIAFDYIFEEYAMFIQKFNLTWEDLRIPYSQQYQALCLYTVLKKKLESHGICDICANWPKNQSMSNVGGMLLLTKNISIPRQLEI